MNEFYRGTGPPVRPRLKKEQKAERQSDGRREPKISYPDLVARHFLRSVAPREENDRPLRFRSKHISDATIVSLRYSTRRLNPESSVGVPLLDAPLYTK